MSSNKFYPVTLTRHRLIDLTPMRQGKGQGKGSFGYIMSRSSGNSPDVPLQYTGTLPEEKVYGIDVDGFIENVLTDIITEQNEIALRLLSCSHEGGLKVDASSTYISPNLLESMMLEVEANIVEIQRRQLKLAEEFMRLYCESDSYIIDDEVIHDVGSECTLAVDSDPDSKNYDPYSLIIDSTIDDTCIKIPCCTLYGNIGGETKLELSPCGTTWRVNGYEFKFLASLPIVTEI